MNPYMRLQRALGCKTLSTDLAGERLLAWKDKTSAGGQRFKQHSVSTHLTCVSSQVLFQLGCVHELVMTLSTFRQRFTFIKRNPTVIELHSIKLR